MTNYFPISFSTICLFQVESSFFLFVLQFNESLLPLEIIPRWCFAFAFHHKPSDECSFYYEKRFIIFFCITEKMQLSNLCCVHLEHVIMHTAMATATWWIFSSHINVAEQLSIFLSNHDAQKCRLIMRKM